MSSYLASLARGGWASYQVLCHCATVPRDHARRRRSRMAPRTLPYATHARMPPPTRPASAAWAARMAKLQWAVRASRDFVILEVLAFSNAETLHPALSMSNDYREYLRQCKLSLSPSQKQSPTGERAKNDSNQDHKRQQEACCEASSVRRRLAGVIVVVILHESRASSRKTRRSAHAAV